MTAKPSIVFIGAGNVASALAPALRGAGYEIREIVTRDLAASRRRGAALARRVKARSATFATANLDADILWIVVTDDAIPATAKALAERVRRGQIALHASGALTSDSLRALKRRGLSVASLHPMMSFARGARPRLRGVTFAADGDRKAVGAARKIAADLGGHFLVLKKQAKVYYHLAGAFSCPMAVALLAAAEEMGKAAGLTTAQTRRALRPIAEVTLRNAFDSGPASAFTGPVRRADVQTLRKHFKALGRHPNLRKAYLALVEYAAKSLPVSDKAAILQLILEEGKSRR